MYGPEGNSWFCFPESPDVSRDEVEGNTRTLAHQFALTLQTCDSVVNFIQNPCSVTIFYLENCLQIHWPIL